MHNLWKRVFRGLSVREVWKQLKTAFARDSPFDLAAQLAYWATLALFPFTILILTLCAYLPLHGLDQQLLDFVHRAMPGDAASLIETTVKEVVGKQHGWLLLIALVGAAWTASGGISAAITALDKAWEVDDDRAFWKLKLMALGLTIAGVVLAVLAMGAMLIGPEVAHDIWSWFGLGDAWNLVWKVARWPVVVLAVMAMLALVYWLLPNTKNQRFRFVTPGAVLATLLWVGLSLLFSYYAARFAGYSKVYGALGAGVALMTWLYLSGLSVIIGGILNAILDHAAAIGSGQPVRKQDIKKPE